MTRARALKEVIRARAAKTGERYTTARRHVLKELQLIRVRKVHKVHGCTSVHKVGKDEERHVRCDAALKHTGHGLDHWFGVLDRFGAVEKGHTASARHLHETHGVDGWYAQGITVSYEREPACGP